MKLYRERTTKDFLRCRGHQRACGTRQYRWRHLLNGREAARCGEWAQHFSNASCLLLQDLRLHGTHFRLLFKTLTHMLLSVVDLRLIFSPYRTNSLCRLGYVVYIVSVRHCWALVEWRPSKLMIMMMMYYPVIPYSTEDDQWKMWSFPLQRQ